MKDMNETLPELMRRATEHLEPPSTDLVERGMNRGMTLRRRRTVLRGVTSATAVLVTAGIVVGGTQIVRGNSTVEAPTAGNAAASAKAQVSPAVTQEETLATLLSLLPQDLKVSRQQTWGSAGFNGAAVVVDDGQGPSKISIAVSAEGLDGSCSYPCKLRPDGTMITTSTGRPTSGKANPSGVISNSVNVFRPGLGSISLISFNSTEEKGADKTRAQPALSVAALTRFADSEAWRFPPKQPAPTANVGKPAPRSPGDGKPAVPVQQTLQTLKTVMPRHLALTRPQTRGGGSAGHNGAAYVSNDGRGLSRIDVLVTYEQPMTKCGPEGVPHCEVRADGAVVGWVENQAVYSDGRQQLNGVVSNRAEIHYPDGRVISMTSYNGPQEKDAMHTRTQPVFTPAELITMAGSKAWRFPGTGSK